MSRQGVSFFVPAGLPDQHGLVSRIFFPTSFWTLDRQDTTVLDTLCRAYERVLPRIRMELSFLGHADHRLGTEFNFQLGLDRARAVKGFVDRRLGHFPLYSSVPEALSVGEAGSFQPIRLPRGGAVLPTADQMASDRRLDIFNSFLGEDKPPAPPPPFSSPPRVRRVTFRRFRDRRQEVVTGDPRDDNRAAEREQIFGLVDGTITRDRFVDQPRGEEVQGDRNFHEFQATHRVNRVVIVVRDRHEVDPPLEIFTVTSTVTYQWGPPTGHVTVELRMISITFQGETINHEPEMRVVPRADGNPFLFPRTLR